MSPVLMSFSSRANLLEMAALELLELGLLVRGEQLLLGVLLPRRGEWKQ